MCEKMRQILVVVCACAVVVSSDPQSLEVRIDQGVVRGYKDSRGFYAFYGIPYATAPTGPLKFKAPQPPPNWTTPLEAVNQRIVCPQNNEMLEGFNGEVKEDCLIANVFVPNNEGRNLSVVVYVHGGAFQVGFGNMLVHTPFLQSGKVIEVTFNYRLGLHGFLCLGTEDAPGNAGMKDQVAALRWVRDNIAAFGGNPNDVTLAGYSAGSTSVELLMLSESAEGLFHRVIPESGAAISVWAVVVDPLKSAENFARRFNFKDFGDIYALEEFYKNINLTEAMSVDYDQITDGTFDFAPCLEQKTPDSFLTETPREIMKKKTFKIFPTLNGFTNMEGMIQLPQFEGFKMKMNDKFSDFLPSDLHFPNEEEKEKTANDIKVFYFGDKDISDETVQGYVDFYSDILFTYPALKSVEYQVKAGSNLAYFYQFCYAFNQNPPYNLQGADHATQAMIIGDTFSYLDYNTTEEFENVKQTLVDLWLSFITEGTPSSPLLPWSWPAVSKSSQTYLNIDSTSSLGEGLLADRFALWDRIYEKYYQAPIPPKPIKQ